MSTESVPRVSLSSERRLMVERTRELLKGINIPARPTVLVKVLDEQSEPEVDLERIAEIIGSDVALSASMLKIVNSPFFGLQKRVGSVHQAVRLLGVENIVNIVTGLMLHSAFEGERGAFMNRFWDRSNQLAVAATTVSSVTEAVAPEEAYTVGLFCDCGVPILLRRFPEYAEVYEEARTVTDQTVRDYEDDVLGTDHAVVGYLVARTWKLPEHFAQCILRHHDTDDYYSDDGHDLGRAVAMLAVVKVAQAVCLHIWEQPTGYEWSQVKEVVLSFLDLDEAAIADLTQEVREGLEARQEDGTS